MCHPYLPWLQRKRPTYRPAPMEGVVQRRERPKRFARNRLARCAVRHAVPARYRNRPLPLRLQRQPHRHRPARRQTDQLPVLRQRPPAPNQPRRRSHHRHRTRQAAPRNLPHTG